MRQHKKANGRYGFGQASRRIDPSLQKKEIKALTQRIAEDRRGSQRTTTTLQLQSSASSAYLCALCVKAF
jgi:hypothetical protein